MGLLELRELRVAFRTDEGIVRAVNDVSLSVNRGRTLGIVGESGSGKTVTALTILGLTRAPNAEITGQVLLDGQNLLQLSSSELRAIRGRRVAMIFQDPLSSLHPMHRVGWQIAEAIRAHKRVSGNVAHARTIELLRSVGIPGAESRVDAYPHELSGGMRQRVMIAMALALGPDVLIADEPTSELDVTVQAQILQLLGHLQGEMGMALVLVSHDLGVIAEHTDEIVVMYAGRIVEHGSRDDVIGSAVHPYTRGLLESTPHVDGPRVERLTPIRGSPPNALDLPSGCAFHPRCAHALASCAERVPALERVRPGHTAACPVMAPTSPLVTPSEGPQ